MKCGFDYCIYNREYTCILDEIKINEMGMCDSYIIVSVDADFLEREKRRRLKEIENRWTKTDISLPHSSPPQRICDSPGTPGAKGALDEGRGQENAFFRPPSQAPFDTKGEGGCSRPIVPLRLRRGGCPVLRPGESNLRASFYFARKLLCIASCKNPDPAPYG